MWHNIIIFSFNRTSLLLHVYRILTSNYIKRNKKSYKKKFSLFINSACRRWQYDRRKEKLKLTKKKKPKVEDINTQKKKKKNSFSLWKIY